MTILSLTRLRRSPEQIADRALILKESDMKVRVDFYRPAVVVLTFVMLWAGPASRALMAQEDGFVPLFNGTDLTGWVVPAGDNGHWKVVDGVIDYDAGSESQAKSKDLWTEREYRNFVLTLEWRIKATSGQYDIPIVLSDGNLLTDAQGAPITLARPNADSGIYVRGTSAAQINIWCWPVGSGEVYGYRNNAKQPAEIRAGVTPRINADKPVGEWNEFIIVMTGDRLTVLLNNQLVLENAQLPGVPEAGRIALQHHGGIRPDGSLSPASSLVQFRNIRLRELP